LSQAQRGAMFLFSEFVTPQLFSENVTP
jgi:hypothetical protein